MKKNKANDKNLIYLAFCECGTSRIITKRFINTFMIPNNISTFMCANCGENNKIPNHITSILDELEKAL